MAFGRYLARTTCAQYDKTNLRGASAPDFSSPDLQIVAAYSFECDGFFRAQAPITPSFRPPE